MKSGYTFRKERENRFRDNCITKRGRIKGQLTELVRGSVEETLIEMYMDGVSVWLVGDITETLWNSKVSPTTIGKLNKKAYVYIEDRCNRALRVEVIRSLCGWDLSGTQPRRRVRKCGHSGGNFHH